MSKISLFIEKSTKRHRSDRFHGGYNLYFYRFSYHLIYTNQVPEKKPLSCPWLNSTSLFDPFYRLVLKITRLQDVITVL